MDDPIIQVQWTASGLSEARIIVKKMLEKSLIACASLAPWIESHFNWEGERHVAQETKVFLKTTRSAYPQIQQIILEEGANKVPEILIFRVDGGLESYLQWVKSQVVESAAISEQLS